MQLLQFVVKRLISMVFILIGVAAVTFFLVRLAPGDPAQVILGQHAGDPVAYHALYKSLGFDQPLWKQFVLYVLHAARGDLGVSESSDHFGQPVLSIIGDGLPVTLALGGMATLLALIVGIPLGVVAAVRHNSLISDNLNMGVMMALYSLPPFVIVPFIWSVFGVALANTPFGLPVQGWAGPRTWIAPVCVFAAGLAGLFARSVRSFMLEELSKDYIRTARAKGLSERTVIYIHALKNTLLPLASVLGPTVAFLVVGAFIIENLFSIPGIAYATVNAATSNDYTLTLGTTLVLAAVIVVVNALTDIFYTIADPRVRL